MPFTVDYGPISQAMQLAQGAGAAQRQQIGFGEDMSALGYLQNAQKMAQTQRATEIQQSLQGQQLDIESQRNQAQNQLAQNQLTATSGYRQGVLQNQADRNDNTAAYNSGRVNVNQQNADTNANRANNTDDYHQMLAAIGQQNANTKVASQEQQGQRFDAQTAQGNTQSQQQYYNSLAQQAKTMENNAARNFTDATTDPNYQAIKQQMQAIQMGIKQGLQAQQAPAPVVNPRVTQQIAQQGGVGQQMQAPPVAAPTAQQATPQFDQQGNVVPGSRGQITSDVAAGYLRRVGYHQNNPDPALYQQAQQAAAAEGWVVPGINS